MSFPQKITRTTTELPYGSLDRLGDILSEDKTVFLEDVEKSIHGYIIGTGRQCIAIVQKTPEKCGAEAVPGIQATGIHRYELHLDDQLGDFVKVLFKFMTKKRHDGHELDSALTAPILEIIEQKFVDFYQSRHQLISREFLTTLQSSDLPSLLESFVGRLSNTISPNNTIPQTAQKEIVHRIFQSRKAQFRSATHDRVANFQSTVPMASVPSMMAATSLARALSETTYARPILANFMEGSAFKKVVFTIVHRLAVSVIVGAVLMFLGTTFGVSVGGAFSCVIVFPVIAGIIYAQIKRFPTILGQNVSKSVRDRLSSEFEDMNREILTVTFQIFQEELLEAVAADQDIREKFSALIPQEFHDFTM